MCRGGCGLRRCSRGCAQGGPVGTRWFFFFFSLRTAGGRRWQDSVNRQQLTLNRRQLTLNRRQLTLNRRRLGLNRRRLADAQPYSLAGRRSADFRVYGGGQFFGSFSLSRTALDVVSGAAAANGEQGAGAEGRAPRVTPDPPTRSVFQGRCIAASVVPRRRGRGCSPGACVECPFADVAAFSVDSTADFEGNILSFGGATLGAPQAPGMTPAVPRALGPPVRPFHALNAWHLRPVIAFGTPPQRGTPAGVSGLTRTVVRGCLGLTRWQCGGAVVLGGRPYQT